MRDFGGGGWGGVELCMHPYEPRDSSEYERQLTSSIETKVRVFCYDIHTECVKIFMWQCPQLIVYHGAVLIGVR